MMWPGFSTPAAATSNWICTTSRATPSGTLLSFGLEESRRDTTIPDAGRQIALTPGPLAKRFEAFLSDNPKAPGIKLLRDTWGIRHPEVEV